MVRRGLVKDIFQNKGQKTFLFSPRKGVAFTLHSEIEYLKTQVMYDSDSDKVKLEFARNTVIGCNVLKDLLEINPYNSLKANMYQDLVGSQCAFVLLINS